MPKFEIYHNPRCSKSRNTLKLLQENGVELDVRLYLENPPSAKELKSILKLLGVGARGLLRTGEDEYQELKLADKSLSEGSLIDAMVRHPRLIERPIVIRDRKAAKIGRPPEAALELLK